MHQTPDGHTHDGHGHTSNGHSVVSRLSTPLALAPLSKALTQRALLGGPPATANSNSNLGADHRPGRLGEAASPLPPVTFTIHGSS